MKRNLKRATVLLMAVVLASFPITGTKRNFEAVKAADRALEAQWEKLSVETATAGPSQYINKCTVSLYPNWGKLNGYSTAQRYPIEKGWAFFFANYIPEREGYEFLGWSENEDGSGELIEPESYKYIYNDLDLYAQWKEITEPTQTPSKDPNQNVNMVSIVLDPNGGRLLSYTSPQTFYIDKSKAFFFANYIPERDGYEFLGWNTKLDGTGEGAAPRASKFIYGDKTFYAQWKSLLVQTEEPTMMPTQRPTAAPTQEPTVVPTQEPTTAPTQEPTVVPTQEPTTVPTQKPTEEPTMIPTQRPTAAPTQEPTVVPTQEPMAVPTEAPAEVPTMTPEAPAPTPATSPLPIELKAKSITIGKGEKVVFPLLNKKGNTITYHTSNKKVASVGAKGTITGKQAGSTKIYAVSNGKKYTMTVKVKKKPVTVKISRVSSLKMSKGDKLILQAVLNKGAASYHLIWKTSNKKVVGVSSSGVATIKGKGKAVITVTTYNGVKGKLQINIK